MKMLVGEHKKKTAKVVEADHFDKEITLIRCHAIMMKDEHGQVIYTFAKKKEADEFYKELSGEV
jgi:sensor histidine kinase regulating citrate/malate metabolism